MTREKSGDPVALDEFAARHPQCLFARERLGAFSPHPPVVELLLFLRTRVINGSRSNVRGPPGGDGIEVILSVDSARATAIEPFVNRSPIHVEEPRDIVDRCRRNLIGFTRFFACRLGLRTLRNGTLGGEMWWW